MFIRSLRNRIAVFFSLLFAVVLGTAFVVTTTVGTRIAHLQNIDDLKTGQRVYDHYVKDHRDQLIQSANLLTGDFGFRSAVTSNDMPTIVSVLENHRQRIGADLMMLFSLDGTPETDNYGQRMSQVPPEMQQLFNEAQLRGSSAELVLIDNVAYNIVVVPVRAPEPVAWIALGFVINDAFAQSLGSLMSLEISFIERKDNDHWQVLASSLHGASNSQFDNKITTKVMHDISFGGELVEIDGYDTLMVVLTNTADTTIMVALQRSVAEAIERFRPLRETLLLLAGISLLLTSIASFPIARGITRPMMSLAAVARRMQQADYSHTSNVEVEGDDEIKAFATTFNHMREAIIARESDIQRLAYQDVLTELPNRTKFHQYLDELVQKSRQKGAVFVVLMLDIDRFKEVNDTLGHESGDQLLKIAGKRLSGSLRKSDIIARLGGDEFGILLPNSSSEQGLLLIRRIQNMFNEHVTLEKQPVDVGVSIGMALFPDHGDDAHTLLRRADIAMYTAKRNRSSHAIFDPEQDAYRREHLHLLGELRHAIDVDELMLVYQPKITVADERVVGVEALTRWNHPQRGIMLPGSFIPFAEHTGAIRLVTRWVIDRTLRQCGIWQTRGIRLTVSFNVSVRDLLDHELPQVLEVGLRQYGVPAGQVYIEITEGSLMEDPVKVRAVLGKLRELGVQLAIDDYGTGYSSLAYLKDLPVSELKIDRAFIMDIAANRGDMAIVRSTIELGHNLGLSVVAEGVEDADQLAILQELGCDQAQGYYFGKPMSEDVLEQWLSERHSPDRCGTGAS